MGFFDSLIKVAADARKTMDDVSKTVSQTAASVQKAIDENETVKSVKKTVGEITDKAGIVVSEAKASMDKIVDDFIGLIIIKLKGLIAQIDFKQTISDIEKAGKENDIDVTPLVNFIKQLQNFSKNG
ncbi:MAG: hypothetical protein ACI4A8_05375 [Muribaculaceae bacterium]